MLLETGTIILKVGYLLILIQRGHFTFLSTLTPVHSNGPQQTLVPRTAENWKKTAYTARGFRPEKYLFGNYSLKFLAPQILTGTLRF